MLSGTRFCLFLLVLLLCIYTVGQTNPQTGMSPAGGPVSSTFPDSIDVYIFDEAANLWETFGDNIWPSYQPDEFPVLLYRSPELHWLMKHPSPPDAFTTINFLNSIFYFNNQPDKPLWSHFSATIWPINDAWTTILPSVGAWLDFCQKHNIPVENYPPDLLVLISLHERFHAYQIQWLEPEFKNIFELDDFTTFPQLHTDTLLTLTEDSPAATLCLEEQKSLYKAYQEKDPEKSKQYIKQFIGLREKRVHLMKNKQRQAENYMELIEGTAKYIEIRLALALQGQYSPIDAIKSFKSFRSYQNAKQDPLMFIAKLSDGDLTDSRVYASGSVICLLLDRHLGPDWKNNILENYHINKSSLFDLLKKTIR